MARKLISIDDIVLISLLGACTMLAETTMSRKVQKDCLKLADYINKIINGQNPEWEKE